MTRIKDFLREAAIVLAGIAFGLLLFVLAYGALLTAFGIDSSCAEDLVRYPVAYVDVKAESWLNVRDSPAGDKLYGLACWTDVVILTIRDGWALVSSEKRISEGRMPYGWVCAEYLKPYREYICIKREPAPGDADSKD